MKPFDPFGDFATEGYLRNHAGEKHPDRVRRLEHHAFAANILPALETLRRARSVTYEHILQTHQTLFNSVYPWAGQDRLATSPGLAVGKAGHFDLFAHPRDIRRAAEYGLDLARDKTAMRHRPGEAFGLLAYAHPFLEGNGRVIMTVHADLARRAGIHIAWEAISKPEFLTALTTELRAPGTAMDTLLKPHIRAGAIPTTRVADGMGTSASLNPTGETTHHGPPPTADPPTRKSPGPSP